MQIIRFGELGDTRRLLQRGWVSEGGVRRCVWGGIKFDWLYMLIKNDQKHALDKPNKAICISVTKATLVI
jgi:hypothetical protein